MHRAKSTLNVVGRPFPPWVTECFQQRDCKERGIDVEFLDRTLRFLGYSRFKYLESDTFDSRIEMLQNGTADISVNSRLQSEAIKDKLGMTVVVFQDMLIYWVKDAVAGTSSVVFSLSVCDWNVWLLLGVFVIGVMLLSVIYRFNQNSSSSECQISYFTIKGTQYVWWLMLAIFLGVYANLLAIALSIPPKAALPFKDLEDLSYKLKSGTCRIVVVGTEEEIIPGSGFLTTVVPSNESSLPPGIKLRLMEAYRANPPKAVASHDEMIHEIRTKSCYIGIDYYLAHPLMQSKYCGVKWIQDDHSHKRSSVFVFRKDLTETLGNELQKILTVGSAADTYLRTIIRTAVRQTITCLPESTTGPLILGQLYETFAMLIASSVIAIILCILENIY